VRCRVAGGDGCVGGPQLRVVLLGSGGWMATPARATSSLLVVGEGEGGPFLLDAGTGVAALCRQADDLIGDARRLTVVLSHFHLDHVVGLTYLPAISDRVEVTVWAPGRLLGGDSTEILGALVGPPFLSVGLASFASVRELRPGSNEISSHTVETRVQPRHPGGSVAFRLGDDLAYCTDTAPDPDSAAFVRGVSTLVHEAWTPEAPTEDHSSAASAARTAADGGVGRLVLSHIHPLHDDPAALRAAARPHFPDTEVGYDGQAIGRSSHT
jgi:ribonuclease BN (tRNA processing enzyme)